MAREPHGLLEQVHWSAGKSKKYHYDRQIGVFQQATLKLINPTSDHTTHPASFWQLYHQI